MTSLVNKSADWTPNYHKILIFSPPKSYKSLHAVAIDELADSNKPAKSLHAARIDELADSNEPAKSFRAARFDELENVIFAFALI